ncbi:universal stress protein [Krasilnikoviella flava]|uniref:Nucleotide-binding universal stress protein, UspA family n=1 Tax=Krasilnikoviella flava TaxID=526729 RepID=A0A1T5LGZ5_9MICO|nr:universal stress protein [Krasilnikoviella flava]SKC74628.1 Nucleotide-binding universal stress protein, UspA family [Krasilnikoviella flava]
MRGIVVGVNGSAESDEALDWAMREAASAAVPLTLVMVAAGAGKGADAAAHEAALAPEHEEAQGLLDAARARTGLDVEGTVTAAPGPAADRLLELGSDADMLVLGRRRRGRLGRAVLGSVSTTVVEHAGVPVTVVRHGDPDGAAEDDVPAEATPRIVVGVDTSTPSVAALRHACQVAARTGASIDAVFAWQITTLAPLPGSWGWAPPVDDYEKFAADSLAEAVRSAGVTLPPERLTRRVVHGQAAKQLVAAAHGAERLVVGARGLGGFDRLLLGSVSRQVLDFAPCPVTVVRG